MNAHQLNQLMNARDEREKNMTKAQHTQGKGKISGPSWNFHLGEDYVHVFAPRTKEADKIIAEIRYPDCEDIANAHLIAAAPELLAALENLLPMWQSGIDEPWVKQAKAAIAKAKGE